MENIYVKENHKKLIQKVKEFAETEILPMARELDDNEEFSEELTRKMGQLGLFGMFLPEKYGGRNTDYFSMILAIEELAKVDGSQASTVAAHNALGIGPIFTFGTEEQKLKYLPELCSGEKLWAFGLTEPNSGSDSRATESNAEMNGKYWIINGRKTYISNASSALAGGVTLQVITAIKDGEKELSSILVEKGTPGYTSEKMLGKLMWRASDTATLEFKDCKVPFTNLLGERGKGSKIMLQTLDTGRLSIAAMGLGLAEGAYEMARTYANKRNQFGKPISKFQVIAFKLADMATKIEAARNLLYHACWLKDNGHPFGKESSMAKLFCSEVAKEVADEAVQIHGAYGLMKDNPVERFYRDQRLLQIGEGTSEIIRLVISRHINNE